MTRPASGRSQRATRQVKYDNSLGVSLSSEHILTPPVASRLLFFTAPMMAKLLVFKASSELERWEWEQGKLNDRELTVLTESHIFFSGMDAPWIVEIS